MNLTDEQIREACAGIYLSDFPAGNQAYDLAIARAVLALAAASAESAAKPVAWVDDLSSSQPHCVTGLQYRSAADAEAGKAYIPLYAAPQVARAEPAGGRDERQAFEAWLMDLGAAQRGAILQKLGENYLDGRTRSAWQAWQARASLAASQQPQEKP